MIFPDYKNVVNNPSINFSTKILAKLTLNAYVKLILKLIRKELRVANRLRNHSLEKVTASK